MRRITSDCAVEMNETTFTEPSTEKPLCSQPNISSRRPQAQTLSAHHQVEYPPGEQLLQHLDIPLHVEGHRAEEA